MLLAEDPRNKERKKNEEQKKVLSFLLAGVLTLGCFPVTAGATNNSKDGTKPADGTTVEQPFPENVVFGGT